MTQRPPIDDELRDRLLSLLRALNGAPTRTCELAAAAGCSYQAAHRELAALRRAGKAAMTVRGGIQLWAMR